MHWVPTGVPTRAEPLVGTFVGTFVGMLAAESGSRVPTLSTEGLDLLHPVMRRLLRLWHEHAGRCVDAWTD